MKQDESLALVVLAALLHDIGKFGQRAQAPCSERMEHEYCPTKQNYSSHKHVLYTDYFIEHILPLPLELESKRSSLARLASAHHKPALSEIAETCISDADRLSSGGDRITGDAEGSYKTARLESVFSAVTLGDENTQINTNLRYRLLDLDFHDEDNQASIFPVESHQEVSYQVLYEKFLVSLKDLPCDMGIRHYIHSLSTILERYTWCIPSSTYRTKADISLYDHAWTTASIAQALITLKQDEAIKSKSDKLILFGGDLSGIQKYIFGTEDISGKGANKLLRARSFLLQALVRSIWTELLERVSLFGVAKIMDAGGRFILLLPATEQVKTCLEKLEYEVEKYMFENYQGILRMTFAKLEIAVNDLERTRFYRCFETFNDRLDEEKLRPFKRILSQHTNPILPVDHAAYAEFGECVACRMRPASANITKDFDTDSSNTSNMCDACVRFMDTLGRCLPTSHYMLFDRTGGGFKLFGGLYLRLLAEKDLSKQDKSAIDIVNFRNRKAYSALPFAGYIPIVRQEDMDRWKEQDCIKIIDDKNTFAGEEFELGSPKTFSMLAQEAREFMPDDKSWRSVPMLAACKADVDNLGFIFGIGFGIGENSQFSISRFAMLSRMLHTFFSSYIPRMIEKKFPNIYVVFAGGDDLFVLGPWSEVVLFSKQMRQDFNQFVGKNPAITLSAGLPLFKSRLPMRSIREMADDAEQKAKNFSYIPEEQKNTEQEIKKLSHKIDNKLDDNKQEVNKLAHKNAVTLFGVTTTWDDFSNLLDQGIWLEELCQSKVITHGLLRRLLTYSRECEEFNQGEIHKGLYLSHMAYDIARNCDEKNIDAVDLERLKKLGHDKKEFSKINLSATWALYRTRI